MRKPPRCRENNVGQNDSPPSRRREPQSPFLPASLPYLPMATTRPRMARSVESWMMLLVAVMKVMVAAPMSARAAPNHQYSGENAARAQPTPKTPVPRHNVPNFGLSRLAAMSAPPIVPTAIIDDSKPNPRASEWKTVTAIVEVKMGKFMPNTSTRTSLMRMDRRSVLAHTYLRPSRIRPAAQTVSRSP